MKKWINKKTMVVVTIILVVLYSYGERNLKSNSIYYVKKFKPELELAPIVMAVENIDYIKFQKNQGVKYSITSTDSKENIHIINTRIKTGKSYPRLFKSTWNEINYKTADLKSYYIDSNLEIHELVKKEDIPGQIEIEEEKEREKIISEIKEVFKPVLESNQERPLVNLQWIFNWKYREKF